MQEDERSAHVVGRELELALLHEFLAGEPFPAALVLTGGPGIGKTTLWEAGIDVARRRGLRTLVARPSGAEAQLPFATLTDLLEGIDTRTLTGLPSPQRRALEVALLRAEPAEAPPEPRAIALGLLNVLRALAALDPLLVAVDDIQWIDSSSAGALAFAARRVEGTAIAFLFARRPGDSSDLELGLERTGLERLEVGPLSLGATRRVLSERLGLSLPRPTLRRVFEAAQGNPLFALELGRALAERGLPGTGEELPMPEAVEDLLGTRVGQLPARMRRLMLAVALSADLRVEQLAALAGPDTVGDALDAGLVLVDGGRVRPSHPLLAVAATQRSSAGERRKLHLALSRVVADESLRARHLALATTNPDTELAAVVSAAAAAAAARGARLEAVELSEHALRLTPPGSTSRSDRLLALAEHLEAAGEPQRVTDLLMPELDSLPRGAARVRAQLLLSEGGGVVTVTSHARHFELALAESGDDPVLRAYVLAKQSTHTAAARLERIAEAEAWALEALRAAPQAGPEVEQLALNGLAWARSLRGYPIDDVCERFRAVSGAASYIAMSPERVAGQRLVWRGAIDGARRTLTRLLAIADEHGEPVSYALQRLHVCELELRAGEWETASLLLDEWAESSEGELLVFPMYERCRALLAAGRGLPAQAEQWAAAAIGRAEDTVRWDLLEARRARGLGALLEHEPDRAAECFAAVWAHTRREGVDEPGAFPVAPDLVEALTVIGKPEEAQSVAARLLGLAEQQEHPWGLASAKRCSALVRLASRSYDDGAAAELAQAAAGYGQLGLRFDRARSLLALGRAQRRHRKWAAARDSLERAVAAFDEIGSEGWARDARAELARVGARRPRPAGELTEAERRVAELAAAGRSNKEIAHTLVVTVNTVEVHLSRAYAKLGVRSRAQLTARL